MKDTIPVLKFGLSIDEHQGFTYTDVTWMFLHYGDGTLAIRLYVLEDLHVEQLTTVTVNLGAYDVHPTEPESFFVKSYSENEGLEEELLRLGLIEPVGNEAQLPYGVTVREYRLAGVWAESISAQAAG